VSDTYTTPEGEVVRVIGNNLLVRVEPDKKETTGGIIIPDNVLPSIHVVGEVLAIGYLTSKKAAAKTPIPDLKVGDRVAFVRFLEKTDANPQIKRAIGENVLRIRPADVLLVMDAGDSQQLQ
jgi:co-chaperonin GroES (HSP10)